MACELLLAEIDRIVDCPYPTQLKTLRDLILSKCSDADVAKCMQLRKCRIGHLSIRVLEALRQWPYVLDIITRLARNVVVRDTLLRLEKSLLHDIVAQAVHSEEADPRYSAATAAILAHPLPDGYSLPADVQTVFVNLVNDASRSPSMATLQPVWSILKGTASQLLGILPEDMLNSIEEKLFHIVRTNASQPVVVSGNQLLTLYCLAIMKIIAQVFRNMDSSIRNTKWDFSGMEKYFSSHRHAPKTIKLLVLQTMWACQSQESIHNCMTALGLACELVEAIPSDIKSAWCAENQHIVQKLQQKALACGSDSLLCLQMCAFVSHLCQTDRLHTGIFQHMSNLIKSTAVLTEAYIHSHLGAWTRCVAASSDVQAVVDLLDDSLNKILTVDGLVTLEAISQALSFLNSCPNKAIAQAIVNISANPAFREKLSRIGEPSLVANAACVPALTCSRNATVHSLVNLLLTSMLTHQQITTDGLLLLQLHTSTGKEVRCEHPRTHYEARKVTVQVEEGEAQDWRVALHNYVTSEAQKKQEVLTSMFAQACYDLEKRCESVEEPLRQERDRYRQLQVAHEQLQSIIKQLESECATYKADIVRLGMENEKQANDLSIAKQECEVLAHANDAMKQEHQRQLDELRDEIEAAELHQAAFAAKHQDDLDEALHAAAELRKELSERTAHNDSVYQDQVAVRQKLEKELSSLRVQMSEKDQAISELKASLQNAVVQCEEVTNAEAVKRLTLEQQLQVSQRNCKEEASSRQRAEDEVMSLGEANVRLTEALEAVKQKVSSLNEQLSRAKGLHAEQEQEILVLEREVENAQDALDNKEVELETCKHSLEKERILVHKLNKLCEKKDAQIHQAEAMRKNLMLAMGVNPPHGDRDALRESEEATQAEASFLSTAEESTVDHVQQAVTHQTAQEHRVPLKGITANVSSGKRHSRVSLLPKGTRRETDSVFDGFGEDEMVALERGAER